MAGRMTWICKIFGHKFVLTRWGYYPIFTTTCMRCGKKAEA